MAEPKPLASLTSGLLARKGAAQPAMRRPMMGFGRTVGNAVPQDDLGWNDMGFDVEPAPLPMDELPVAIGLTPMPTAHPGGWVEFQAAKTLSVVAARSVLWAPAAGARVASRSATAINRYFQTG